MLNFSSILKRERLVMNSKVLCIITNTFNIQSKKNGRNTLNESYVSVLMEKCMEDNQFHPVNFASKKSTETERKCTNYELDILGVIETLEKFMVYVLDILFKPVMVSNEFQMTMNKKDMSTKK